MFRPLELFIGLRYTRAKRRNHFISFISLTSMLGIALGVTALITVLSVMNGFQREVRNGILGMAAHSTITGLDGELADWRGLADKLAQQPHVLGLAPYIEGQAMLTNGQIVSGVLIRGVLPEEEPKVSYVDKKMLSGVLSDLKSGEFGIILGRDLAQNLGVGRGDKVTLVTPQANVTPAGILPRLKRFTVIGIFQVGNNEYDGSLALLHLDDAAKLMQMSDRVSGLRLKLDDIFDAPVVTQELAQRLAGGYLLSDWTRQHAIYFRAVDIEKKMMFVILTLIVAVAAFNIVSTMVMVVTDKQADIAILRTLGTTPLSVMAIFMVQGMVIGVIGTLLGMIGGVSLALNVPDIVPFFERLFSFQLFPQNVYLINKLPSEMRWGDVFQITSLAFLLSFSATLYPAWRAARTQPAEALRYE
jgi:lipoprotein-releasing system permease protein